MEGGSKSTQALIFEGGGKEKNEEFLSPQLILNAPNDCLK